MDGVAPDGSPVAIYLALPPGEAPELIASVVPDAGSILELGSGPGRITRPLAAAGFAVVAVDNSPEMLDRIDVAETVLADLFTLDLGREFDAVVAASNLVNVPDRLGDLLHVCRRHVAVGGAVLVERYPWAEPPPSSQRDIGPVRVEFELLHGDAAGFRGRATYRLGDESWVQEYDARIVDDEMLAAAAEDAGLRLEGWLDDAGRWALLRR